MITQQKNSANTNYHTVKPGETISQIAETYKVKIADIKSWNNLNSDKIIAGSTLKVYSDAGIYDLPLKTTVAETKKNENVRSNLQFHTVQRGESLYSISKKYNIPVAKLKQLNEMRDNKIVIGQKLRLG